MNKSGFRIPALALVLSAGLLSVSPAWAQTATGSFTGKVAAGDKVAVHNVDTNFHREVPVKDDGSFRIRHLPVGTYEVTLHRADGSERKVMAASRVDTTIPLIFD